ncbi:hypothetical protein [Salibacterium aidingense]|uniref:hypothetical protein n=1 Tax=Salibacterium aidingense TaxID=384933 RepID=UPI000402D686|nr:hypothetical protein [Salibacterium aidingense]
MFRGNKLVVILPMTLMIFLFIGGSFYINQAEEVTNENLSEEVRWQTNLSVKESGDALSASWEWDMMPNDGMTGMDYIGVTFLDENGDPLMEEDYDSFQLTLDQNTQNDIKNQGKPVENGVVFSVPNRIEENETIGNSGRVHVTAESDAEVDRAVISYLHTWENHDGLNTEESRFFTPSFVGKKENDESFYWVMESFVDRNSEEEE